MRTRLVAITVLAIAMALVAFIGSSDAQADREKENARPVVFSPDALGQTIRELKTTTNADFFDTSLRDVLQLIADRHDLKFKFASSDPTSLVTIKANGKLGQVLVQLLATIKCEYAILPNGVILVQDSTKSPN